MAFVNITPVASSIVSTGDLIIITWSTSTPPYVQFAPSTGAQETVCTPSFPGISFGAGYTGTFSSVGGGGYSLSFRRDAGWANSPFSIVIDDTVLSSETQVGYTLLAEGQYPADMQPFNDPAEAADSELYIQDSGALQGIADTLNFDENLTVAVAGGVATIDGSAGGSGSAIEVVDETTTLTTNLTKTTYTGSGVTAATTGADEVTVTIPGTAGGMLGGIFGTISTDGSDGITLSANSQGIEDPPLLGTGEVIFTLQVPFDDDDYPVQATPNGTIAHFTTTVGKYGGGETFTIRLHDDQGSIINPKTTAISFDFVVGGTGDVSSSASAATIVDHEVVTFDGTTGKIIKGGGGQSNTRVIGGSLQTDNITMTGNIALTGGNISMYYPGWGMRTTEGNAPQIPLGSSEAGQYWTKSAAAIGDPAITQNRPYFTADDGTEFDLSQGGAGSGDVSSSESEGTVVDNEIPVFDGTTGKLIKGGTSNARIEAGGIIYGSSLVAANDIWCMAGHLQINQAGEALVIREGPTPTVIGGAAEQGQYWTKSAAAIGGGVTQNRPYYTSNDGTEYDLSSPAGNIALADLAPGTHSQLNAVVSDRNLVNDATMLNALDATGVTDGWVITADGADGFDWEAVSGAGGETLDATINGGSPDNDVLIPTGDPIIFRDNDVAATTPLTLIKIADSGDYTTTLPALKVEVDTSQLPGISIENTGGTDELFMAPSHLQFSGPNGFSLGGRDEGASPGDLTVTANTSNSSSTQGGISYVRGGSALGTTSDGGDLYIFGGPGTSADGTIYIGGYDSTESAEEIDFFKGFTMRESADHPVTPALGKGQFWVRDETGDSNTPMFTDAEGTDYTLNAGSGDVSSDGTTAVIGEAAVYTSTGQKQIGRSDTLLGAATSTVGTRQVTGGGLIASGHITTGGTLSATGNGCVSLGKVVQTSGTAQMVSSGDGSLASGYSISANASGTGEILSSGLGSVATGYAQTAAANTSTIEAAAPGSLVGGDCADGGTIDAVGNAYGATVRGYSGGTGGGILRATTDAEGALVHGRAFDTGSSIIASGDGSTCLGNAEDTADISASAAGAFAGGHCTGTSSTISVAASGGFAHGHVTGGGTMEVLTENGAFAGGSVVAGTITSSGTGSFAYGGITTAGDDIRASGQGSLAFGFTDNGGDIVANGDNTVQFFVGTNGEEYTLAVGNIAAKGMRICGLGVPASPQNGDMWMTTGGNFRLQSLDTVVDFSLPDITGSRASGAALLSLLTELAGMGLITDSSET